MIIIQNWLQWIIAFYRSLFLFYCRSYHMCCTLLIKRFRRAKMYHFKTKSPKIFCSLARPYPQWRGSVPIPRPSWPAVTHPWPLAVKTWCRPGELYNFIKLWYAVQGWGVGLDSSRHRLSTRGHRQCRWGYRRTRTSFCFYTLLTCLAYFSFHIHTSCRCDFCRCNFCDDGINDDWSCSALLATVTCEVTGQFVDKLIQFMSTSAGSFRSRFLHVQHVWPIRDPTKMGPPQLREWRTATRHFLSKTFLGSAVVVKEFESEAQVAEEMLYRVVRSSEQFSFQMYLTSGDGSGTFCNWRQRVSDSCFHDAECLDGKLKLVAGW